MADPATVHGGISRHSVADRIARHRHTAPYAALVLSGGYVEAGDLGRHRVVPGDMLVHGRFDAHQDRFGTLGTQVLNLPVRYDVQPWAGRVADPDAVARLAETDLHAAGALALAMCVASTEECGDWPDLLAAALRRDGVPNLTEWAAETGVARTSLSRGFALAYGVSPQRYRAEHRAKRAIDTLLATPLPLAAIAADKGFSDQAHMTRDVARLTGVSPSILRRAYVTCVQDGALTAA